MNKNNTIYALDALVELTTRNCTKYYSALSEKEKFESITNDYRKIVENEIFSLNKNIINNEDGTQETEGNLIAKILYSIKDILNNDYFIAFLK